MCEEGVCMEGVCACVRGSMYGGSVCMCEEGVCVEGVCACVKREYVWRECVHV